MQNQDNFEEFAKIFREIDKESLVILKGHLLIEECLNCIIERFVHHSSFLYKARLTFYQKLYIARSMAFSDPHNPIWLIIEKISKLRNNLAHNLETDQREKIIQEIIQMYNSEMKDTKYEHDHELKDRSVFLAYVIAFCIGFLNGLKTEIIVTRGYSSFIKSMIKE